MSTQTAAASVDLQNLNCSATLSNGLLTLENGVTLNLALLVNFVKEVSETEMPDDCDDEHDMLFEIIEGSEVVLEQSNVMSLTSNSDQD